jgi:hypothetical protein
MYICMSGTIVWGGGGGEGGVAHEHKIDPSLIPNLLQVLSTVYSIVLVLVSFPSLSYALHFTENSKQIFPEMKLLGLVLNSYTMYL